MIIGSARHDNVSQGQEHGQMTGTIVRQTGGCLVVTDSRVFHQGLRTTVDRLVEGLIRRPEVKTVRVDLSTATCQIRFEAGADRLEQMAGVFCACLREAIGQKRGGIELWWRRQRPWTTLWAGRHERGAVCLEALDERAGRLCLRVRSSSKLRRRWNDLLDEIGQQRGILTFRVRGWPEGVDIDYDPSRVSRDEILATALQAWNPVKAVAPPNYRELSAWPSPRRSEFMVRGPRRLLYLALGCGSLAMTFVGLVIPGIPTVPFLFASSYYLARSSRTLHRRLLESRLLGQILREWETHRALSQRSKWKLTGITLVVIVVTVLVAPLSPLVILVVAIVLSLTLIGLYRIPTIETAHKSQLMFGT
jgi:uncharacterized membrane protein YbaN (DUF454 family)